MGVTKLSHNLLQQLKKISLKKQNKELHTVLRTSASSFLDVEIVKLLREKYDNITKILVNNPKIKINRAKNYLNIDGTLFFISDKNIQESIPGYKENVRNVDNMQFYNIGWLHEHAGDNLPTIKELENAGKVVGGMNNLFSILGAEETGFMIDGKSHERALPDTNILPVKTPQTGEFGICKRQRGEKTHIVPIHEKNFVGAAFKNTLVDTENEELITENMIEGLIVINRDINILFDTVDTNKKIDDTLYTMYTSSKSNKSIEEIYAQNSLCVPERIQDHFEVMIRGLLEKFPASKPNFERIKKLLFEHMEIVGYNKSTIQQEWLKYFNIGSFSKNNEISVYHLLHPHRMSNYKHSSFIGDQEIQHAPSVRGEKNNTEIMTNKYSYGKRSYYDKDGKKILTQYEYGNYPIALYSKAREQKLQKRAQMITDINSENPERLQRLVKDSILDKACEITLINGYTAQITHSNDSLKELPNIIRDHKIQLPKNRQETLDIIGKKLSALQNKTIMTQEGMYPIIQIPGTNAYTLAMKTYENAYNGTVLIDTSSYHDPFYQGYRDELAKNLHAEKKERFGGYKARKNLTKATKDPTYVKAKVLHKDIQDVYRDNEIVFTLTEENIDPQAKIQEQRQALLNYTGPLTRDTIVWMVKNIPLENLAQAPLFSEIIKNRRLYEDFLCSIATRSTHTQKEDNDKQKILQSYLEAETSYQLSYATAGRILAYGGDIAPTIISHIAKFTERASATDICYFSEVLGKHYEHKDDKMIQGLMEVGAMDTILLMLHTKSIKNISQNFLGPILEYTKKIGDEAYTKLLKGSKDIDNNWTHSLRLHKDIGIETVQYMMNTIIGTQEDTTKPIERELGEKKRERRKEELKKLDGQDAIVTTNTGEVCEGMIVVDSGEIYIVHNNLKADKMAPQEKYMYGYNYGWRLYDEIHDEYTFSSIQLRKPKENIQKWVGEEKTIRSKGELKQLDGQEVILTTDTGGICEGIIGIENDNVYVLNNSSHANGDRIPLNMHGYTYARRIYTHDDGDNCKSSSVYNTIQLKTQAKLKQEDKAFMLGEKRSNRSKGELKKLAGKEVSLTTSTGDTCIGTIIVDNDRVYIMHNDGNVRGGQVGEFSEKYGYKYSWLIYNHGNIDSDINNTQYKSIQLIQPEEKPIERELGEKKISRSKGELKKMDGQDVIIESNAGAICEGKIVIDNNSIYVVHNNPAAQGGRPSTGKLGGYTYGWNIYEADKPDKQKDNRNYRFIQLRKKKEDNEERILGPKRKSRTKRELKDMEGQDAIVTTNRGGICEGIIKVIDDNIYVLHNNPKSDIGKTGDRGYKYSWPLYDSTDDRYHFSYIQFRKKKKNTPKKENTIPKEMTLPKEHISFIRIPQKTHPDFYRETPENISGIKDWMPLFEGPLTSISAQKLKEYGYTDLVVLHKETEKLPAEFFTDEIAKDVIAKHTIEVFIDHIYKFHDLSTEIATKILQTKEIGKYKVLKKNKSKFKDFPVAYLSVQEAEKCLRKYGLEEYSKYTDFFDGLAKEGIKKEYDTFFAKNNRDEIVKYNLLFIDLMPIRFRRRLERHGYTLLSYNDRKTHFATQDLIDIEAITNKNDVTLPEKEMYIDMTKIVSKKAKKTSEKDEKVSEKDEYLDTKQTRTAGELRAQDGKKVTLVTEKGVTCEGKITIDGIGSVYIMHENPRADDKSLVRKHMGGLYKYGRKIYEGSQSDGVKNQINYRSITFTEPFPKLNKDTTLIEDIIEEYDQFCMPRDIFYHGESKKIDIADRETYIVKKTRNNEHSYGFDTIYIVDLTDKAKVYIKKIADTRKDKKYIQISDVKVQGDDIIITTSIGVLTEKYQPLIERNKLVQEVLHDRTDTYNEKVKALNLTESEYTQAIQTLRAEAREDLYPEHAQLDRVLLLVNKDPKYGNDFAKMISADKKRCKTNSNIARIILETLSNNFRGETELLSQMHTILMNDIDLERKIESQAKLPEFDKIYKGNGVKYRELMAKIIDLSGDDFVKLLKKYSDKETLLRICIDQNKRPRGFFMALGVYDYGEGIEEIIQKNPEGVFQDLLQDMMKTGSIEDGIKDEKRCFEKYKYTLKRINNPTIQTSLYLQLLYANVTSMKEYLEQDMARLLLGTKNPHCSKIFRYLNEIGKFDAKKVELDGIKLFYALRLDLLDKDYLDDFALFLATQNLSDEIVSQYTEEFVECIRGPQVQETGESMDDVIHGRYEACHEARIKAFRRLLTLSTEAYRYFVTYINKKKYDVSDFKKTVYTAPGI